MKEKIILGVDLGGTNVRVGKVSNYKIVDLYSQQITSNGTKEQVIDEVVSSIKNCFDDSVIGIGMGVPSLVDVENGIVYDVQNIPSWKEVHLKSILESEFNVPVYINNDANCFIVGEKYFGQGQNYDNLVGLVIGTGLGGGIFFDNKLYVGANCGAGEFGMLPYKDGCFEDYCSGQYFISKYGVTGEEIYNKAKKGDEKSLQIFKEFGEILGDAISAILFVVDPEIIIMGGSISKGYEYYRDSMMETLGDFPYRNTVKNLTIAVSKLSNVAVLGAAALYFENRGIYVGSPELELLKTGSDERNNS